MCLAMFVFAFTNVHLTLWMRWNEQVGQSHNPGCNNTRVVIKQRYVSLSVVRILRLTKVNGFHLYKVNLICLLMYWGFLLFYNTKLFDNCFFILHHMSSSSCSSLRKFLFQLWFFLLVTLIIGRSASAVGRLPPIFFNFFSWLFPLWYSLAQNLLQNIGSPISFASHCSSDIHLTCVLLQIFGYICI